jgi:octaprenyl-diphosphate synthase
VLDEALMRRHLATVNSRWDNESSVLLGDFLFTHAFYLASTLDDVLGCRWIGQATNIVCEGELRQKGTRGNFALSESEYLDILAAKTGALTAVSCRLGAYFAGGQNEAVGELEQFGRELGVAFQIADDMLDLEGDEETVGKSLGTDIEKQKPTLPIIRTLEIAEPDDRRAIIELVSGERHDSRELHSYLQSYGALEYTRRRAESFARSARTRLGQLRASRSLDVLTAMTEFVVNRPM